MQEETRQRLVALEHRYDELNLQLSQSEVLNNQERYRELMQEHSAIDRTVQLFNTYRKIEDEISENKELLELEDDADMKELVEAELDDLNEQLPGIEEEILFSLLPQDPRDERSVFIEIRSGAGGDEAALFASELYRMYQHYASNNGYRTETMELNETEIGGIKEIIFSVEGKGAWSKLKYEMGVHRVQRVPVTEAGGRIHTSTVTVAVMPEAQEVDVAIDPKDLRIDTYRASGAGGQHVNMTDSAIRITHIPTGVVVTCQDERSQHKNREKAMRVLRSRLYEVEVERQEAELSEQRREQIGTGDRSERIRTYNYHQGRVTDHRIGLSLYKLEEILSGELELLIDPLMEEDRSKKLLEQATGH